MAEQACPLKSFLLIHLLQKPIRRKVEFMAKPLLILCASLAMSLPALAQVQLITDAEAHLPDGKNTATRAITRGPGIRFESATDVPAKSFGFKVTLEPRGGAKVDPQSLKVEYLKEPIIDLTERVKAGLKGNTIDLPQTKVPVGNHPIRITVRDSEGRTGSQTISLNAK